MHAKQIFFVEEDMYVRKRIFLEENMHKKIVEEDMCMRKRIFFVEEDMCKLIFLEKDVHSKLIFLEEDMCKQIFLKTPAKFRISCNSKHAKNRTQNPIQLDFVYLWSLKFSVGVDYVFLARRVRKLYGSHVGSSCGGGTANSYGGGSHGEETYGSGADFFDARANSATTMEEMALHMSTAYLIFIRPSLSRKKDVL